MTATRTDSTRISNAKRLRTAGIVVSCIAAVNIIGLTVYNATSNSFGRTPVAATTCHGTHTKHQVVVRDGVVRPKNTVATLCDTLNIINADDVDRLIAFGPHEHHQPYDGVTEEWLSKNQSLTVTLNQTGVFGFHDHIHDEVIGTFTVTQ